MLNSKTKKAFKDYKINCKVYTMEKTYYTLQNGRGDIVRFEINDLPTNDYDLWHAGFKTKKDIAYHNAIVEFIEGLGYWK